MQIPDSSLKRLRKSKNLTQKAAAEIAGISLRSYIAYESDPSKEGTLKYEAIAMKLMEHGKIDEEHGVLSVDQIKEVCSLVFSEYPVNFCYLFDFYAKGEAGEKSDVDLLVDTGITGLKFYELVEALRESLKKKVDLLDLSQLLYNETLLREVMKDGIKIFG